MNSLGLRTVSMLDCLEVLDRFAGPSAAGLSADPWRKTAPPLFARHDDEEEEVEEEEFEDDDDLEDEDFDDEEDDENFEDEDFDEQSFADEECLGRCMPSHKCYDNEKDGVGAIDPRAKKYHKCPSGQVCCSHEEFSEDYQKCGISPPNGVKNRIVSSAINSESEFGEWPFTVDMTFL